MITDTTPHYRVTVWLPSGPLELTSRTEPRRLDNGEVIGDWVDHLKHGRIIHIDWHQAAAVMWKQATPGGGLA